MSISADTSTNPGHGLLLGYEKSVAIKIDKSQAVNKPQSVKIDPDLAKRQSIKTQAPAEPRKSVASLVNEKKDSVGVKIDISV